MKFNGWLDYRDLRVVRFIMNTNDSAGLIKTHLEGMIYRDPRKVDGIWVRGIVGYQCICRELTDDLELTDKFTLSEGQGYAARHGLTFARAYIEYNLRLVNNKLPTGGKRVRKPTPKKR
jgi:hypothetical protein